MTRVLNPHLMNVSDMAGVLPRSPVGEARGHESFISCIEWSPKKEQFATWYISDKNWFKKVRKYSALRNLMFFCIQFSGSDGTVRVWSASANKNAELENILVFEKALNVFGNDLKGEKISNLKWSANSQYLAATLNYCLNIWTIESTESFIDDHPSVITAIAWPQTTLRKGEGGRNYLIVGRLDGTLALITICPNSVFSRDELPNCSEQSKIFSLNMYSSFPYFFC